MTIRQSFKAVSANIVFEHPSIHQLAQAIEDIVHPGGTREDIHRQRTSEIESMVAKYAANIPTPRVTGLHAPEVPVILLTGSTGNIGSHILAFLLLDSRVGRVYTLNRPSSDPIGRLKAALADRELPISLLDDPRLVSLTGDVTQDNFGLDKTRYDEVRTSHD